MNKQETLITFTQTDQEQIGYRFLECMQSKFMFKIPKRSKIESALTFGYK